MDLGLISVGIFASPVGRLLLIVHLAVSVFTLGVVTHHWWSLLGRNTPAARLARYARWMAIAYPLAFVIGVLIYPSYNVLIRKPPIGVLEHTARWAVGMFEIKEHLGCVTLAMLPWLVISAHRYGRLSRLERISYAAGTWVFTLFVYYVFVAGALVATIKSF